MDNIAIKVLSKVEPEIILELKKLEIENLGRDASINEWIIPVFIKYGKVIVVVKKYKYRFHKKEKIIAVNEILKKWDDQKTAFIHSFYVKKAFRNLGIGGFLLKESIDILKKENIEKIELTVAPDNHTAIKLYEKYNFKKVLYLPDIYGEGVHRNLMRCKI